MTASRKHLRARMPRVLLLFPTSIMACRWMLHGILRYVHRQPHQKFRFCNPHCILDLMRGM